MDKISDFDKVDLRVDFVVFYNCLNDVCVVSESCM